MPITIKEIPALETYAVRHPVLRAGRPIEDCGLAEDNLETTFHLGAYDGDRHVGVATFLISDAAASPIKIEDATYYQLRGMGVLPDAQGKGIGKLLMLQGMEKLRDLNVDVLWFNARIIALPFYERLGFLKIGKPFEVPKIGTHYKMYKEL